jgi:hypothetical protein
VNAGDPQDLETIRARQRARSTITGWALAALVLLIFLIALVRLGALD